MIHKKRKRNASFEFSGHIQGRFRPFLAYFGRFSACFSCIGRQPIRPDMADTARFWPNQPDSAQIEADSAWIEPHRCELSRVGANPRKKKKSRCGLTRGQPHRTPRLVSRRVGRGCGTYGAASMLSSQHHDHHKRIRSGEPWALSGPATSVRTSRLSSQSHSELTTEELVAKSIAPINKHFLHPLPFRPSSNDVVSQTTTTASAAIAPSQSSFVKDKKSKRQLKCEIQNFFFSLTLNFLREQTKIIYIISL